MVLFNDFSDTFSINLGKIEGKGQKAKGILHEVPAKKIITKDGKELLVTTAFYLTMGQAGVSR